MRKIIIIALFCLFLLGACAAEFQKEELSQQTAERIARFIEQKNWDALYNLAVPELKENTNIEKFRYNAEKAFLRDNLFPSVIRLDKVSADSPTETYAYYTASYGTFDAKLPALSLVWLDDGWFYDGFAGLFVSEKKQYILSEDQIHSSLKLGRTSITRPAAILQTYRTSFGGTRSQTLTYLPPWLILAWKASLKELTPEEVEDLATNDEVWFIPDVFGDSITFDSAVDAVIEFEDGTFARPFKKESGMVTSSGFYSSPRYSATIIFTFKYSELKGKKFKLTVTNQGSKKFDFTKY